MCGLAGFVEKRGIRLGPESLRAMGRSMEHRGPDAEGVYINSPVGLSHRRLSIIDLNENSNQPMVSPCGRYVIVFNGEIYNFLELRDLLISDGVEFQTKSDTEVLLHLFARRGESCLDAINGMFAFCIWDNDRQQLFIARDRLGKKPLYIYEDENLVAFASEIKGILPLENLDLSLRPDAIQDFFFYQYVPDPKTIYQRIRKLRPGHFAWISPTGVKEAAYWDVKFSKSRDIEITDAADELKNLLADSVKQRMIADVPLGAFLSGGIDSSAIVGIMSQHSFNPVNTCTIGFDDKTFDESYQAREVSRLFGTNHNEMVVKESITQEVRSIAEIFDEPFADPSLVPTYFVSKLARQAVTVALSGDGGDENFAGYAKYPIAQLEYNIRNRTPKILQSRAQYISRSLSSFSRYRLARKSSSLFRGIGQDHAAAFFDTNSFFNPLLWQACLTEDFSKQVAGYSSASVTQQYFDGADTDDHVARMLYTDLKTFLPGGILVKVDRTSMANSLETRAPLLDYRIVEFAASLPSRLKLAGNQKKIVLKKAAEGLLPAEVLHRRKMGFSVPLASWLVGDLRALTERLLFSSTAGIGNFLQQQKIRTIWEEHLRGRHHQTNELWSMVMFEIWWQKYVEGN